MSNKKISIGDYLLLRLKELGISHIFGVPGDYNLGFLDQIVEHPGIEWLGTCNELNGAYASDGYARIKGFGALVTTFGVGELSAINGIAGAYAEYVPVINIVGVPATTTQQTKALVHHTLGDGRFEVFAQMYSSITVAQTFLSSSNAAAEIDRVLVEAWCKKRPVYIALPSDVSYLKITAPAQALKLAYPASNMDAVNEMVERAAILVNKAKTPVILIDICAQRHGMVKLVSAFINKTGIPFATMNMGKGIISEAHPQYIGTYNGDFSTPGTQARVENSDCIISFGTLMSDFNTGGFTSKINANVSIEIHSYHTRVKQSVYNDIIFRDVIPALTKHLESYRYQAEIVKPLLQQSNSAIAPDKITQKYFWARITSFLEKDANILAEAGTSLFGTYQISLPEGANYIGQTLWGSIGYTVGALLGVSVAAPAKQNVLFIGDGSFQLTAQELSTLIRHQLCPIIFLLNNDGYTVERIIHGPTMIYNDVQPWHYAELPKVFANHKIWSKRIENPEQLENALKEIKQHKDTLAFVEVMMDKMDAPEILIQIAKAVAARNKYSS